MKLNEATFSYAKGYIIWIRNTDNAPMYEGTVPKYIGKRYPWTIIAKFDGFEASWDGFGGPTPARAERYLKVLKEKIKEANKKS